MANKNLHLQCLIFTNEKLNTWYVGYWVRWTVSVHLRTIPTLPIILLFICGVALDSSRIYLKKGILLFMFHSDGNFWLQHLHEGKFRGYSAEVS